MGKRKNTKRTKIKLSKKILSKVYFWIFIIAAFFTGLFLSSLYAYADLEACQLKWGSALENSNWPVRFILWLDK